MENITVKTEGSKLIIEIDLNVEGKPSSTGKMQLLAKTGGFTLVKQTFTEKDIKMNLTLGYKR